MAFALVAGADAAFDSAGPGAGYVLATVLHLVTTARLFSAGVDSELGRAPVPRGRVLAMIVVGVAAMALGTLAFAGSADLGWALLIPLLAAVGAGAAVVRSRSLLLLVGGAAALVGGLVWVADGSTRAALALAVATVFSGTGVVLSIRASVWMLGVVWEQEHRREVDARLAVAEERLRFSRDLHDVFGRTLSTVAVTSELAAELTRRGDPRGVETMLEVRELAQNALREVRAVVDGYRTVELATELAGAQDVLRSAGVRTRVTGADVDLDPSVQQALGWVVREGVTNVVRHAEANECTIDVVAGDREVLLVLANDGVRDRALDASRQPGRAGAGLRGLRERLGAVGGSVDVDHEGTRFTLRARVPRVPPLDPEEHP